MSGYKWDAEEYEKYSAGQQKWAKELISKLNLKGDESILDIGCGDGKVTAELARSVKDGNVIGIDTSEVMVKLASERHSLETYPNLTFRVMGASELVFNESFDIIFSNAALHWVRNHQPVIHGIYKSLKPGGKILLQMGGKGNAENILSVLDKIISQPEWSQYFSGFEFPYGFYSEDEYKALLAETGFENIRAELIPKDMIHSGKAGLEGWIRTTWLPYTQRIPENERERFIDELSSRYIEENPVDPEGNVHVAMVRIEIEAVKPV